jgi:hypothetical protein
MYVASAAFLLSHIVTSLPFLEEEKQYEEITGRKILITRYIPEVVYEEDYEIVYLIPERDRYYYQYPQEYYYYPSRPPYRPYGGGAPGFGGIIFGRRRRNS